MARIAAVLRAVLTAYRRDRQSMALLATNYFFPAVAYFLRQAGVFVFLIVWVVYGAIYRWRATRMSDQAVERALERMTMPVYRAIGGLIARRRAEK